MGLLRRLRNAALGARLGFRAAADGFSLTGGGAVAPYEGATTGRRLGTWGLGTWGPTSAAFPSLRELRSRAREMARNNPWVRNAVEAYVSNLVGTGIVPRWVLADAALKAEIQAKFEAWIEQSDADGLCDFYGQQALVARTYFQSGEVLVRFRPRLASDGLVVPLQIQVLEPDHLDESQDGHLPDGRVVQAGIEFDSVGRRRAYHMRTVHPGEARAMSGSGRANETVRVPASEVLHVYNLERPGQNRGVPRIASALLRLHEFDQYEDAEVVRKKAAAMIGGFITEEAAIDGNTTTLPFGTNEGTDAEGQVTVAIEPGTYGLLRPGQDVKFGPVTDVGGGYSDWTIQQLRAIAAGFGVTYEQLTGDYQGVTFSSVRAALVEFRRRMLQEIWHTMIFRFCQPVAVRWLEVAVASGAVRIPGFARNRAAFTKVAWRPQRWEFVDPLKDVVAEKEAVRSGFKSRTAVVGELGEDAEALESEIAAENARADAAGFMFDSDPRKTAGSGAVQAEALVTTNTTELAAESETEPEAAETPA